MFFNWIFCTKYNLFLKLVSNSLTTFTTIIGRLLRAILKKGEIEIDWSQRTLWFWVSCCPFHRHIHCWVCCVLPFKKKELCISFKTVELHFIHSDKLQVTSSQIKRTTEKKIGFIHWHLIPFGIHKIIRISIIFNEKRSSIWYTSICIWWRP